MAQDKKQSFMKGAAILSPSTLIVKMLGLLFPSPWPTSSTLRGCPTLQRLQHLWAVLMLSTAGLPVPCPG